MYVSDLDYSDEMLTETFAKKQRDNPGPESEFVKPYWYDGDYSGMEYHNGNPPPYWPPTIVNHPPWPPIWREPEPPDDDGGDDDDDDGGGDIDTTICQLYPTQTFVGVYAS